MKTIILSLTFLISSLSFADVDANTWSPDAQTQMAIITAMLSSDTAKNSVLGDSNIADVMATDVKKMLSGQLPENITVTLNCEDPEGGNEVMCTLFSFDDGVNGDGESALLIRATVVFKTLSTKIKLTDVEALIAG